MNSEVQMTLGTVEDLRSVSAFQKYNYDEKIFMNLTDTICGPIQKRTQASPKKRKVPSESYSQLHKSEQKNRSLEHYTRKKDDINAWRRAA